MVVLRGLGWLLLLMAAVLGVYEVMDFLDSGDRTMTPVAELWNRLRPASLAALKSMVDGNLPEGTWAGVVQPVLDVPAISIVGGAALLCLFIGIVFRRRGDSPAAPRRRRRRR
jgi:hypothetical protein